MCRSIILLQLSQRSVELPHLYPSGIPPVPRFPGKGNQRQERPWSHDSITPLWSVSSLAGLPTKGHPRQLEGHALTQPQTFSHRRLLDSLGTDLISIILSGRPSRSATRTSRHQLELLALACPDDFPMLCEFRPTNAMRTVFGEIPRLPIPHGRRNSSSIWKSTLALRIGN